MGKFDIIVQAIFKNYIPTPAFLSIKSNLHSLFLREKGALVIRHISIARIQQTHTFSNGTPKQTAKTTKGGKGPEKIKQKNKNAKDNSKNIKRQVFT